MNQKVTDMAEQCFRMAKKSDNPLTWIANFTPALYWLNELHSELIKEKEITPFRKLGYDTKLRYWTLVCLAIPKKDKFIKILACFAAYTFDLINEP